MQQIEFHVSDMSCSACEQRIEKALARVEGVVRSAADHGAGQVRVVSTSRARPSKPFARASSKQATRCRDDDP